MTKIYASDKIFYWLNIFTDFFSRILQLKLFDYIYIDNNLLK